MAHEPFESTGVDVLRVNFQDSATGAPSGYFADRFLGFGDRGNGFFYGWVTEASVLDADGATATPIDPALYPSDAILERSGGIVSTYDPRLTGFAHFDLPTYPAGPADRVAWEVGVSNGWYEVTVSIGDVAGSVAEQAFRLFVEGAAASSFEPTASFRTGLVTVAVEVTDGFLTLDARGGSSTKIQYLEVRPLEDPTPDDNRPAPDDYAAFIAPRAVAQDGAEVFETLLAPASGFAGGVDPEADIFLGVAVVEGRGGIDLSSLLDGSFRLYETLTGAEVAVTANTTAAGDSVTVEAGGGLKANTSYTLVVDGAVDRGSNSDGTGGGGVDGDGPRAFQKFSTTFVTGDSRADVDRGVAFTDRLQINGAADGAFAYSSATLSADRSHLYVATLGGQIIRWALDPLTGEILKNTQDTFTPFGDFETIAGRRGIIGLTFDPEDPSVLWISDNWPIPLSGRDNSVPDFSGRISKVTLGADDSLANATIETYLTGLPRSNGDHVTNSLQFRANPAHDPETNPDAPPYLLYVLQGSNTAMGAPDSAWGFRPERLLSAAVLEIDPSRTPPPGGFDVTTEPLPADGLNRRFADVDGNLKNGGIAIDSGPFTGAFLHFDANGAATVREGAGADSALIETFYDPFAADAVLKVYATGPRNAYDLLWHSNGSLYVPTNGSAAGGNVPDNPNTAQNEGLNSVPLQPDLLLRVEQGGYYGHPNALHDHFVLNGGNPTAGVDPFEVAGPSGYAVGVQPDAAWDPDALYSLGNSRSPNGVIEYHSDVWGDRLQNAIIFTEYSGGNDLRAVLLDDDKSVIADFVLRDFNGKPINHYLNPLDLVADQDTGRLYMITLNRVTGESQIVMLDPAPPPFRIEAETFSISSGFTVANSNNASGGQILQGVGTGEQRASMVFTGPSGYYAVDIGHFDENDGVARMAMFVDGIAVDAFLWDQELGSPAAAPATLTTQRVNVFLENGATIELRGFRTAGEPLRTDYLEFSYIADAAPGSAPVNSAPSGATTIVNQPFAFTGAAVVSVSDADSGSLTTTLRVENGAVSLGATGAAVVVTDGGATTTISGTTAQVNAALAGLTFTPAAGFVGDAAITVETSDGGLTDTDTISVTVGGFGDPDAVISVRSRDPGHFEDRLHFNWNDDPGANSSTVRDFKDTGIVFVSNDGTAPLQISGFDLSGPFKLADPAQLNGVTLQPGAEIAVEVQFDRAAFTARPNGVSGVFEGRLDIFSNDLGQNSISVDLAGHWQNKTEGGWEPNVNEVWEVFGFGNRIPDLPLQDGPANPLDTFGLYEQLTPEEVLSPHWKIADGFTGATFTLIGRWSGPSSEGIAIHRPFAKGSTVVNLFNEVKDSQTVLPDRGTSTTAVAGVVLDPRYASATFTNTEIPDGWVGDDVFSIRGDNLSSDPSLNTTGDLPSDATLEDIYGHWMRIFQAIDAEGNIIPNVYLGIQDKIGINSDFNDLMFIISGVTPASQAPVNAAPAQITMAEDSSFAFTGANAISVSDPDGAALTNRMTVLLSVEHGTLVIDPTTNVTITGSGTGQIQLVASTVSGAGNTAQNLMNAALAKLIYTPTPNYDGPDALRIVTNDRALKDIDTVAITVTNVDDDAPIVLDASAPEITVAGGTSTQVTVHYRDDVALDLGSLGIDDIRVVDPSGGLLSVTNAAVTPGADARTATVVYTVAARGGVWEAVDNGAYQIELLAGSVADALGATAPAAVIGSFEVALPLPPATRVEAETLTRTAGFTVANLGAASGGQVLANSGSGEQRAEMVFGGEAGRYSVTIGYFDENDGVASMRLLVNDIEIGAWLWDQDLGTANGNAQARASRTFVDVALRPGDVVEIAGFANGGEPLRTDYLDFQFLLPLGEGAQRPNNATPNAVSLDEDGVFAFSGVNAISVSDPDSAALTTTLSVSEGVLNVAAADGVSGDGTATVVITGSAATINAALAGLTYAPAQDFFGDDVLTIVTSDGALNDTDTVDITVAPVNDAPTAGSLSTSVSAGEELLIALPIDDVDDELSALELTLPATSVFGGVVVDNGGGQVSYTPAAGFTGADSFTYSVTDPGLLSSGTATVTIEVGGVAGTPPTAAITRMFDVNISGGVFAVVQVTYNDNVGLDVSTLDAADLVVTGPGGALSIIDVAVSEMTNGSPRVVSYSIGAPGGAWDAGDNGVYTISLAANQVFDIDGFAAAPVASLGGFTVTAPAAATLRVEAEDFTIAQGFVSASIGAASAGGILQAVGSDEQIASYVFTGAAGVYDLGIGYFDENDGEASLQVLVNGEQIDSFVWDQDLGFNLADNATAAIRGIAGVALRPNDVVELRGFADGIEPLRVDYVDFQFVENLPAESFRVEAEAFALLQGFKIQARSAASGGANIEAVGGGEQIASYVFTGMDGLYNLGLGHFDENDGVASMRVLVNGAEIDSFQWSLNTGSANPTAAALVERAITDVALRAGDVIQLRGFGAPGEPIRTDYLDFDRVGDLPPPPDNTFRVEAETFTIVQGFGVEVIGPQASGDTVLRSFGASEQIATYTFAETSGVYDLAIGYFDENDGSASMRVLRNGTEIDSFLWNEDLGSPLADPSTATVHLISGVTIQSGDIIALRGFGDGTEPLRTDYVDFTKVLDVAPPPAPFRVEAEAFTLVQGFKVQARSTASGGANIEAVGGGEQIASYVFNGTAGVYDLALGHFDENDGVGSMRLLVNNEEIDAFQWDQDTGSASPAAAALIERQIENVALEVGDVIELRGFGAPGEPLRTDYLDIVWVDELLS